MDIAAGENCIIYLDGFEGPLDLLLHLINRSEVDIEDLPVATITAQYLDYIRLMEELNINVAAEFLVMAAELLRLKSKMLLPQEEKEELVPEEDDPRLELVRRLQEYSQYKEVALGLGMREQEWIHVHTRYPAELDDLRLSARKEVDGLSVFDLLEAFKRVLDRSTDDEDETGHAVVREQYSIEAGIRTILSKMRRSGGRLSFTGLFPERPVRREVIVTLLALLELMKKRAVRVMQMERFGEIEILFNEVTQHA